MRKSLLVTLMGVILGTCLLAGCTEQAVGRPGGSCRYNREQRWKCAGCIFTVPKLGSVENCRDQ